MLTAPSCTTAPLPAFHHHHHHRYYYYCAGSIHGAKLSSTFNRQCLTVVASRVAGHRLPLSEGGRRPPQWAGGPPGSTAARRRAGLDLWHRAHHVAAAARPAACKATFASQASSASAPIASDVQEPPQRITSSWGVFSHVNSRGGAVTAGSHGGWREKDPSQFHSLKMWSFVFLTSEV